jgi:hypothetical protein
MVLVMAMSTPALARNEALGADYNRAQEALHGIGRPRDPALARDLFRKCAKAGDADAIAIYAQLLEEGRGGPADLPGARRAWREAVQGSDPEVAGALGHMLLHGLGGPRDAAGAKRWLTAAAEHDDPKGQFDLYLATGKTKWLNGFA